MKTLEQLLAQVTELEGKVTALTGERDAAVTALATAKTEHKSALDAETGKVTALTAERDTLKAEVVTLKAEVATAKAAQTDFDGKVAMKVAEGLAKHGIRTEGVGTDHKANGGGTDADKLIAKATARAAALA